MWKEWQQTLSFTIAEQDAIDVALFTLLERVVEADGGRYGEHKNEDQVVDPWELSCVREHFWERNKKKPGDEARLAKFIYISN